MPSAAPENVSVVSWSGETFRLIPSRFPPVNVYEGLIANDRQEEIVAVENLTNPRLRSLNRFQQNAPGDVSTDPLLQNWNLAPFAYGNPDGSIFFGEDRPCLEVALERQTALAVSVSRRQAFLEATNEQPIGVDMRMLCTPVDGKFWDLRGIKGSLTTFSKHQLHELGSKLPAGAQGILYHPSERPAGTCLSIVTGEVLQRAQQTVHFRYMWAGNCISQLYALDKQVTPIRAEALAGENDVIAVA